MLIGGKCIHHMFQRRGLMFGLFVSSSFLLIYHLFLLLTFFKSKKLYHDIEYKVVPPALLSGVLGLIWFCIMDRVDPELTSDLSMGLEALKGNLINFVFASLILGLTSSRAKSHHITIRGVVTSLLHEGIRYNRC